VTVFVDTSALYALLDVDFATAGFDLVA